MIGDCHSAALVSRTGSIDWCCLPRFDAGSAFGRLLDRDRGGHCSIRPRARSVHTRRRYLENTLVLETVVRAGGAEARMIDGLTMPSGPGRDREILRAVDGLRGRMSFEIEVEPRFDCGRLRPWITQLGVHCYAAVGGDDCLIVWSDADLEPVGEDALRGRFEVGEGQRVRLAIRYIRPHELDGGRGQDFDPTDLDDRLERTIEWWREWASHGSMDHPHGSAALRSAITLKAMTYAPTGAMIAAATTSLPESPQGARTWDYRYSWIRDSAFAVRSLARLGFEEEADGFRRFVERSAAGHAEDLRILFGVGGERHLMESTVPELEGYRGAKPVRIGNGASTQLQLDVYGHVVELAWRWHQRGHSPDDDYWRFLMDIVETAAARWEERDRGIWEVRGRRQHFVHSKVMCWAALDRGIRLATECGRRAPLRRWRQVRREIRSAVEQHGYDRKRGVFTRSFGTKSMDAALLLLPQVDFVPVDDERMMRTVDEVRKDLGQDGLLLRYRVSDGIDAPEGVFLPASFWAVECLAGQGRLEEAEALFERAVAAANDLGLFSEEYDPGTYHMLGNFPQALTHMSHIGASVAIAAAANQISPPL